MKIVFEDNVKGNPKKDLHSTNAKTKNLLIGSILVSLIFISSEQIYVNHWRWLILKSNIYTQESEKIVDDLRNLLERCAPQKEVLITLSDMNLMRGQSILEKWLETVINVNITNYIIIALDKELEKYLLEKNINVYYTPMRTTVQKDTGSNHAISALKYGIILRFLELGWAVLLSDTDVVTLSNPFLHLYRDSDIEGMSDGYDDKTAYGTIETFDDPEMGWSRFSQGFKHHNLNSGLFYIQSNQKTRDLMTRLEERLNIEVYWDQTAFNEEIFFLSHGSYNSTQITVRVMDIYEFTNSKTLFKFVRYDSYQSQIMPVMIHVNYHPDKYQRMEAIVKYYLNSDKSALNNFKLGSE